MDKKDDNWGPKDKPEGSCRYLASDGKYYNGYIDSPDFDPFKEVMDKVCEKIKKKLEENKSEKV